jgi:hypothetical protein
MGRAVIFPHLGSGLGGFLKRLWMSVMIAETLRQSAIDTLTNG